MNHSAYPHHNDLRAYQLKTRERGQLGAIITALATLSILATACSSANSSTGNAGETQPSAVHTNTLSPALQMPTKVSKTVQRDEGMCTSYAIPGSPSEHNPPPTSDNWSKWALQQGGAELFATKVLVTVKGLTQNPITVTGLRFIATSRQKPQRQFQISNECGDATAGRFAVVDLDQDPPRVTESSSVPRVWGDEEWRTTPLKFPYTITDQESESILLIAQTTQYVEWYAELSWTDGETSGTEKVDSNGEVFRTASSNAGPYVEISNGNWVAS